MRHDGLEEGTAATTQLSDAYREVVGSVLAARTQYDRACTEHGADSEAAKRAGEHLSVMIDLRNRLRDQYDRVMDR